MDGERVTLLAIKEMVNTPQKTDKTTSNGGGLLGGRMCHFLKPLKLTQELGQKMSYSSEFWYGSYFYDVY